MVKCKVGKMTCGQVGNNLSNKQGPRWQGVIRGWRGEMDKVFNHTSRQADKSTGKW
jgi:hypothetical protein